MRTAAIELARLLPLLAVLLAASAVVSPGSSPSGDEGPLIAAAHRLLQGQYAIASTHNPIDFLWHGPGLPGLLAPLIALGVPLSGLRLTSPLLMFLAAVLLYRLLRSRVGTRLALVGAYALALYAPGFYILGGIAKEPLSVVPAICFLGCASRYLRVGGVLAAAGASLALGGLVMTRLEYGWVGLALAVGYSALWILAIARRRCSRERRIHIRRWMAIYLGSFALCVPWLVYTYGLTGHLLYRGNSGGLSLYWMSSPASAQLGQWHSVHTVFTSPALRAYRPLFRHLSRLSPLRQDLRLQHLAIAQALAHPAKFALNLLANVGRGFAGFPFSFRLSSVAIVTLVGFNAALSSALLLAVRRLFRGTGRRSPEILGFGVFAAIGLTLHLLPTAEPRMFLPLLPVAIWVICHGFATPRRGLRVQRPARIEAFATANVGVSQPSRQPQIGGSSALSGPQGSVRSRLMSLRPAPVRSSAQGRV